MALSNDTPIPGLVQGPVREHFADESSSASEHEVEQVLEDESDPSCAPTCFFSSRESPHALYSSSDSDCDSELSHSSGPIPTILADEDEEDEQQPRGAATAVVGTKNEILDPVVVLPDLAEVDPSEPIELIGQVQSIVDSIVIIRGLGSQTPSAAVERVLDADSLLVFEDRKVLGNVFETFGPTMLPMYSVRFPTSDKIDHTQVQAGRAVYHLPHKSFYVFPRALAMLKGSDASNVHDEEPSIDEIEYSDDEAERSAKQRLKNRPAGRSRRLGNSERDGLLLSDAALPYDVVDPYAMDSGSRNSLLGEMASPDAYDLEPDLPPSESPMQRQSNQSHRQRENVRRDGRETRGRGRGMRRGARLPHDGRGAIRGRGRGGSSWRPSGPPLGGPNATDLNHGQSSQWNSSGDAFPNTWPTPGSSFIMNGVAQGYQQQFVAPHINPRFANSFGYNGGFTGVQGQFPMPTESYSWPPHPSSSGHYADER